MVNLFLFNAPSDVIWSLDRVAYTCTMLRIVFYIVLLTAYSQVSAQLQNTSFEQVDSMGKMRGWNLRQGKITRLSVSNFGVIPLTAYRGNYFALLESDTTSTPPKRGILEQTAPFADTPQSLYIPHLYLPENTTQHARILLLFSKWNGTSRDTILYLNDTLPIIANGNTIPIRWNIFEKNLSAFYRIKQLPDSIELQITNDESETGKTVRLYLDEITLGKWPVGIMENHSFHFFSFPNPANNYILIETPSKEAININISSMNGQTQAIPFKEITPGRYEVLTEMISSGLYILEVTSASSRSHQLLRIQH
jgi:hypothetical protein